MVKLGRAWFWKTHMAPVCVEWKSWDTRCPMIVDSLLVSICVCLGRNPSDNLCSTRLGGVIAFGERIDGFLVWTVLYYSQNLVRFSKAFTYSELSKECHWFRFSSPSRISRNRHPMGTISGLRWSLPVGFTGCHHNFNSHDCRPDYWGVEDERLSDKANTPYKSLIEILIESAALYTVTSLICAILVVARACRPDVL